MGYRKNLARHLYKICHLQSSHSIDTPFFLLFRGLWLISSIISSSFAFSPRFSLHILNAYSALSLPQEDLVHFILL